MHHLLTSNVLYLIETLFLLQETENKLETYTCTVWLKFLLQILKFTVLQMFFLYYRILT